MSSILISYFIFFTDSSLNFNPNFRLYFFLYVILIFMHLFGRLHMNIVTCDGLVIFCWGVPVFLIT